ncbi:MAG TPA: HAD-IA family hydrolase [Polyangiaceae bacterium]|nr:HAD-IA family hydrolase [Polyangiaceae bacterium]
MSENGSGVRAVVFDLDGTLVDSRGDIVEAIEVALSRHGLALPSPDAIAGFVGDGARVLVARALGMETADPRVEPVLATYLEYYTAHPVEHTVPMPGALDALDALAPMPLAVCTNKPRDIAEKVLARLGLSHRFAALAGGGDTPRHKPDPQPLQLIAEQLRILPSRLAMVGDGVQDIACGRSAGALTVGVLGGFASFDALLAAAPDLLVANLAELAPALERRRNIDPTSPPQEDP